MNCPHCGHGSTRVVETRDIASENMTRRRRECKDCEERFTTYERVETPALQVVKEDGSTEQFSREKLVEGIEEACKKRPVDEDAIARLADAVEAELQASGRKEVESAHIGDLVLERLQELDEVAYVRFASIYRSFEDVEAFEEEVETLKQGAGEG